MFAVMAAIRATSPSIMSFTCCIIMLASMMSINGTLGGVLTGIVLLPSGMGTRGAPSMPPLFGLSGSVMSPSYPAIYGVKLPGARE